MKREQMDAARPGTARIESPVQLLDECRRVALERIGKRDEAGQIGLAHELTLSERVGGLLEPTCIERGRAHRLACRNATGPRESADEAPGGVPRQERCALEWNARLVQQLFEVGQASIGAAEDRHVLERTVEPTQRLHDRRALIGR